MATQPIKLKRSATPGKIPTVSDLGLGELAINTFDGKAYLKKDDGSESIVELGSGGGFTAPRVIDLYDKDGSGTVASFDGVETRFQIRDSDNKIPAILSALSLAISVNGVIQKPNEGEPSSFTGFYITRNAVAGVDIVFGEAPGSTASFFGVLNGMFSPINGTSGITKLDDISSEFDGEKTSFTLKKNGDSYAPQYLVGVLIVLGGVVQTPVDSYSITGSTIEFTEAPESGIGFYGVDFKIGAPLSEELVLEDKNIELNAITNPSDENADGGGITLRGTTNKTITWSDTTNAWTSSEAVDVPAGSAVTPSLIFNGDTNTGLFSPGADQVAISTNGTGRLFVDSGGRVLAGNATSRSFDQGSITITPIAQVEGTGSSSAISITRNSATVTGPSVVLAKSRGTAVGAATAVLANDSLGAIYFEGTDGTNPIEAALISAAVDGTPNTDVMPGRLVFATTSSTGSTPTERMRLDSSGRLGLGTSAPGTNLEIKKDTASTFFDTTIDTTILLSGTPGAGNGNFGGSIGFSRLDSVGRINAVIAIKQTTSDSDQCGLSFFTHPSTTTGASLIEQLSITHDGKVGIGTTSPDALLTVNGVGAHGLGSVTAPSFAFTGDLNTGFWSPAADTIAASTGGSERARIDSDGKLLVGTATARTNIGPSINTNPQFQIEGTTSNGSSASIIRNSANNTAPQFNLAKTRGSSVGSIDAVIAGDILGAIQFQGSDGVNFYRGGQIQVEVDDTPGTASMPGRIIFSTTPSGSGAPTERARLTSTGALLVGTTVTPTGAGSGAVVAQDRVVIGAANAGTSQKIVGQPGNLTATTGTITFNFSFSGSVQNSAYIKLAVIARSSNNTPSNSPVAEYAFQLHVTSGGAVSINGTATIFEYTFVRATHFAFTDLGGRACSVTLTNPTASLLASAYSLDILAPVGRLEVGAITVT
jgi:hypothetical protein